MSDRPDPSGAADDRQPYFYLSYAPSDPLPGLPGKNPDREVQKFFIDLTRAVRRNSSLAPDQVRGFFDKQIPVASDWRRSFSQVLGVTQVFVALYSVRYLDTSYPGREWACFRQRVEDSGVPDPSQRFLPVLWAPLARGTGPDDLPRLDEALSLGADEPAYRENGLRALMKIKLYRPAYRAVVNLLAKRIVALAENAPITPSEVPDIDGIESEFRPQSHLSEFAIETAAPTAATAAKGHRRSGYGATSTQWRPFPRQELPLAEYARQVAERFDFDAQVRDITSPHEAQPRTPGVMLIDPWLIADEQGQAALASALEALPRWVLPLLVLHQPDNRREKELAGQVRDMLGAAGALATRSARQAALGVSSLDDFVAMMPELVAEAGRQYLRQGEWPPDPPGAGPVPSPQPGGRPRLRTAVQAAEAAPAQRSPGEPGEEKDV